MLNQRTSAGIISIAQSADRRFHVLWKEQSVGDADTLAEAITLAADGPLRRPKDGTDLGKLAVSWRAKDWYLAT